ncbi:cytochrome P450 [Scenedesmus sp. NREL 46B-D3]|nr:cytochrome P450 [Scenedesmus sp. NREL 46B-D3]
MLLAADPLTVQNWFKAEWERGSVTGWPETLSQLLGAQAMATTRSAKQHQRLRELFSPMLMDASLSRMLPQIQGSVQRYMRDWAARGTVPAYTETLTLIFDALVNQAMQLDWPVADIKQYAAVCEVWNQGFRPSTSDPRFAKGMEARVELVARFRRSVKDPRLLQGSIPAALRDEFGADSEIVTDNLIMLLFAGFETSTSLAVRLLYELALNPAALKKLRAEHKAVRAEHGPTLGLAALKDMTYTEAAISETLRIGQIVANVPRIATRAINTPRAPAVPAGCPFSASFCGQSVLDPAAEGSQAAFNPERWLDPKNKASLKLHQHPFGYGTHSCLGYRIARAVAAAMAQELALAYDFSADTNTTFSDFPTGSRPANELPLSLKPLRAVE